jgi:tetratricopeptide (TPR) repeat protein
VSTCAQEFSFSTHALTAYDQTLSLDPAAARETLKAPATTSEHYVRSLSEAIELLVTEDRDNFAIWESAFEKRVDRKANSADELFFKGEIHLQWAFVYLKFGHEFDAALQLRKAYQVTQELQKRFPKYQAVLKTSGLLNVIIGSVPEKYNWLLSVLDMRGDVVKGMQQLDELRQSTHPLAYEAAIWHSFITGFVLQEPGVAIDDLQSIRVSRDSALVKFLLANLYIKNSDSERALSLITELERSGIPALPYLLYLKGEVLLHKGLYDDAISCYRKFLSDYKGENFVKDANYKIGMCHLLAGGNDEAKKYFQRAKDEGQENTEADKYAGRAVAQRDLPNVMITKLRYFTDGGYFENALNLISTLDRQTLPSRTEATEYRYRKARLFHKMGEIGKAVSLYEETIKLNGEDELYFAPNACLQLGYIAFEQQKYTDARNYFEKALSYKKHEYKNSIDSKARSALAQLKGRK